MIQTLIINSKMPGLNEIIAAAKIRWKGGGRYSQMKRKWTEVVMSECSIQNLKPMKGAVKVNILVHDINKRRDPDNILAGCCKFTLDGIVKAGIIEDDSQRIIKKIDFELGAPDAKNPRVIVVLGSVR